MIFKKIKNIKINEDFDFGSVEVESTAATSYNQTPEMVRTITNLPVMLQSVLYGKFGTKVPRGFKYMDDWKGVGRVLCVAQPFDYYQNSLSNRDIALLKDAGFTLKNFYVNANKGVGNVQREKDNLPDVILSLFRDKLGYTGDFSDVNYINVEYLISEDGGMMVIDRLSSHFNDISAIKNKSLLSGWSHNGSPQSFYVRRLMCYTGDVIYKVKMPDSKTIKSVTKSANNNNKIRGAIGRMVKADGMSIYDDALAEYILHDSGKSAVIPYCTKWGGLINIPSAKKHNSNGVMGAFLGGRYLDQKVKVVKEVIDLSDLDNPEIICGYTSHSNSWYMYIISDYNILVKLLGKETADKVKPNELRMRINRNEDSDNHRRVNVYVFMYLNEKGTNIINDVLSGKLKLGDIA